MYIPKVGDRVKMIVMNKDTANSLYPGARRGTVVAIDRDFFKIRNGKHIGIYWLPHKRDAGWRPIRIDIIKGLKDA